jgi:hypothetical protein
VVGARPCRRTPPPGSAGSAATTSVRARPRALLRTAS